MLKSLYSGVSGIQTHQVKMDVIGNNIANVNTVGYKRSDVIFQELLNQTIAGASAPTDNIGGTNPIQIGLGVKVGSVTNQFNQGNMQYTGSNTDLAIEGNGFFIVADGANKYYTRAGNFVLDEDGNLVHASNGMKLQGWMANDDGIINSNAPISDLSAPIGKTIPAKATSSIKFERNLDARVNSTLSYQPSPISVTLPTGEKAQITVSLKSTGSFNEWNYEINAIGVDGSIIDSIDNQTGTIKLDIDGKVLSTSSNIKINFSTGESIDLQSPQLNDLDGGKFEVTTVGATTSGEATGVFKKADSFDNTIQVFDPLGGIHNIKITFEKTDNNLWKWSATTPDDNLTVSGSGTIIYDSSSGKYINATGGQVSINYGIGIGTSDIVLDFSSSTQFASQNSMLATNQNGYASGSLQSFSIDQFGCVNGTFSNGIIRKMAQISLASFSNPAGLSKAQGSFFLDSNNSGIAYIGEPSTGSIGKMISGNLETSNVDLSKEFTDLITTQRGYQANAKLITTSDELLQDLINLKR
jgi:flagellar hook protein FlgE